MIISKKIAGKKTWTIALTVLIGLCLLAAPEPSSAAQKLLDDFNKYTDGSFPKAWRTRIENPNTTYIIRNKSTAYMEAKSNGDEAVQIAKGVVYLIKEWPMLTWEWRVLTYPTGGNERKKKTADSAAALYVILDGKGISKKWPRTIKYVWSATLPVGSRLRSPYDRKTKMVVLRNQDTPKGEWVREKINVYKDLKDFFPKDRGKVRGFAFMTDSDNTKSRTEAHIRGITICSE